MKPPEPVKEGKDDPKKDQEDDPKKDQEDDSKKDQEEEPAKVSRTPYVRVLYPDVESVQWMLGVAMAVQVKVDPSCCWLCERLSHYQESDGESDEEDEEDSSEDSDSEEESGTSEDSGVDSEPDAAGGVKEQPPSRAQSPELAREADSTQEGGKMNPCVQALFPDVWDQMVDFSLLAERVQGQISPQCCYRCGLVHLALQLGGGESADLPKMRVLEMHGSQLHAYLQRKMTERSEPLEKIQEESE
ncbi:UNVERIFIED_CONTAM: hypothetical protein K2H54_027622 [Gekko kuhli]